MSCERLVELKRQLSRAERKRILRLARSGSIISDEHDREKVQIVLECFLLLPPGVSRRRERLNLLAIAAISLAFAIYVVIDKPGRFTGPLAIGAMGVVLFMFLFPEWLVRRYEQTARANGWE